MTGRFLKFGILAAILALVVTAFAAQSPQKMKELAELKKATTPKVQVAPSSLDREFLPQADGAWRGTETEVRSSSRSVSIVDGRRNRVSLSSSAPVVPHTDAGAAVTVAICAGGTTYDYQHNDGHPAMLATLGGDPTNTNVHFTWMQWDVIPESIDQIDRFVNYQGYNASTGLCLTGCGVTISGGGGDPKKARGGYVTCDVTSDDQAVAFFHQRDEPNQDPGSDQKYGSWVIDQAFPCDNSFADNEMPLSPDNEVLWPHGDVDRGGGVKAAGDDVFHVVSHPSSDWPPLDLQLVYWRRIGGFGNTWEGPVALTKNAGPTLSGPISYYPASSPVNEDVSVCYIQDHTPSNPDNLRQVVFMTSHTNGQDWLDDGVSIYPNLLTDNGYSFTTVTSYVDADADGAATVECGGRYDLDGDYHVFWVEFIDGTTPNCRLRHWLQSTGVTSTITQAADWPAIALEQGGDGGRDLVLANPALAFGDGTTNCSDGPSNPSGGNPNSNRNYVYYLYQQYGGETAIEQADHSDQGTFGGPQLNLEFYLSCSNDNGATWMPAANLTNTKTPNCDGTTGNECASERDASMAAVVNDAIHIQYILDIDAGDAVYAQSAWTFNPVMYYKIPGGDDVKIPNGVCPVIAPSFAARLTNQDPDCEFHTTYSPAGSQTESLIIENFGNATLDNGAGAGISVNYLDASSGWLTVAPSGGYSLAPGTGQTSTVVMNAGAGYIQTNGEGLYQAEISITHNDPSRVSPRVIPVDFFVFNEFYCPEYMTLKTNVSSPGVLYLTVSNLENIGNQTGYGGLGRMSDVDGDSSYSIYDGTLVIAVPPNPDTLVYRQSFGQGNGQPGFRALGNLVVDTSAYGSGAGEATAFAHQTTVDSLIGVDVTYEFPQDADSANFVLIKYKIFNRTATTIPGMIVGNAIDFDVEPGPYAMANMQPGTKNTGHTETAYNLIYQQGVDTLGHMITGDLSATRWKGGISSIQCSHAPRGWVASNDPWLFKRPGGGWSEGYLYQEMTKVGFEIFDDPANDPPQPENDRHTVLVHEQGIDLTATTVKHYAVALVSSNVGLDNTDLLNSTKKAWKYAFGWQEYVDMDSVPVGTVASYPYYAIGSHEDGLDADTSADCCGCVITKDPGGSPLLSVGGGEPGSCEGTIELAAGAGACDYPATATFTLTNPCASAGYVDQITVNIYATTPCLCTCPLQGDMDGDGFPTPLDLGILIDVLFSGAPDITDPGCSTTRSDVDCDGFPTPLDLGVEIDWLFAGGNPPCDPCAPK
jgi:hypothetical protein